MKITWTEIQQTCLKELAADEADLHLHFARNVADRILIMDEGQWIEEGPPEEIFTNPSEDRSKQFLAHVL